MKWPCRECIVRARCSQTCPEYKQFHKYMKHVVIPLLMLFSSIFTGALMLYLSALNNYHMWTWVFISGSWLVWMIMLDEDSFTLTLISPVFLPGVIAMKLLAWKYKRA